MCGVPVRFIYRDICMKVVVNYKDIQKNKLIISTLSKILRWKNVILLKALKMCTNCTQPLCQICREITSVEKSSQFG